MVRIHIHIYIYIVLIHVRDAPWWTTHIYTYICLPYIHIHIYIYMVCIHKYISFTCETRRGGSTLQIESSQVIHMDGSYIQVYICTVYLPQQCVTRVNETYIYKNHKLLESRHRDQSLSPHIQTHTHTYTRIHTHTHEHTHTHRQRHLLLVLHMYELNMYV